MTAPSDRTEKVFGAFRTLLGCHLGLAATISPIFIGIFGLFLKPMAADLGWPRAALAAGVSVVGIGAAGMTAVSGHYVDRLGPRAVVTAGAILLPLALFLLPFSVVSWPIYIAAAALLGLAGGLAAPTGILAVASTALERRVGLSLAIAVSGIGLGQVVNSILASHLIALGGWRAGWMGVAVWAGVLGVASNLIIPWRRLAGVEPRARGDAPAEARRGLMKSVQFWVLTCAFLLILLVTTSVATNLTAALSDRGLSAAAAARAIPIMAWASISGRLLSGGLLDIMSARVVGVGTFLLQGAGCFILSTASDPYAAYAAAFLVSFAFGVEADLLPFVLRRRFGIQAFGSAYGLMFGCAQIGAIIGPPLTALAFDRLGTYSTAFVALGVCSCAASLLFGLALQPKWAVKPADGLLASTAPTGSRH